MTNHLDAWPELVGRGQHMAAPARIGWKRPVLGLLATGLTVCLLGAAVLPPLLKPEMPPRLEAAAVAAPLPEPDLAPAEVDIVRTTERIHASQPGDSLPISYRTPRIMQPGVVKVQLSGVSIAGDDVTQGRQVFRFDLVDALTGDTIGTADVTRQDGVNADAVTVATLREPRAVYLRVSAEVRGESTCHGCQPGEYSYDSPIWHTWTALLQYDKAG